MSNEIRMPEPAETVAIERATVGKVTIAIWISPKPNLGIDHEALVLEMIALGARVSAGQFSRTKAEQPTRLKVKPS